MAPRRDRQIGLVPRALTGALRGALDRRDELRFRVAREMWTLTKRFGSRAIVDITLDELPGLADAVVEGYVDDPNRAVLAALCRSLGVRTFFEIGTNRGRTAWTVARNNPDCHVYTLDLPAREALAEVQLAVNDADRDLFAGAWDRGEAYEGTTEEARITTLHGDSARFDFSPYAGRMDFVFVDGAHSYDYVSNDTRRALELLGPGGTIAWDDYPAVPGVYRRLNELAPALDRALYHVYGTRLVLYSRVDLVGPRRPRGRRRQYAA
jgi:predicted O-methyltransferase YrrM